MLCPQCGQPTPEHATFCPACGSQLAAEAAVTAGPPDEIAGPPSHAPAGTLGYAGFWRRAVAFVIDSLILMVVGFPLGLIPAAAVITDDDPATLIGKLGAAVAGFLQRIAEDRRRRVSELKERVPGYELRARLPATRPAGRLERALRRRGPEPPLRLVCEIKRASPSKGLLKPDLDPVAMARVYEAGGAAAASIVTEPGHFQGDSAWVHAGGGGVGLPLLPKDFVVDSYQILDAAVRGADGVLLIAALLSDVQLQRLITEARLLGLDCLVEVHDAAELTTSLRAGATLVGINNRDLRSFEVNPDTALELLPRVPPLVTAVAESGLSKPEDLQRLRATRCDAVLMGEVFMTSPDPVKTLETLAAAARG